jgi:hypothetical protein
MAYSVANPLHGWQFLNARSLFANFVDGWYERAGRRFYQPALEEEWQALVEGLLSGTDEG